MASLTEKVAVVTGAAGGIGKEIAKAFAAAGAKVAIADLNAEQAAAAAREIERVLAPGGIALVKVPFNFPWHGGFADFFRFTPAGYLAAFRRTEAVHIGHGPGPASTVCYALNNAWISLFTGRTARRVAVVLGRLLIGPWRHLDRVLVTKRGSLGSGCTLIFIGRRTDHVRSATEVIAEAKALGVAPVLAPSERPEATS